MLEVGRSSYPSVVASTHSQEVDRLCDGMQFRESLPSASIQWEFCSIPGTVERRKEKLAGTDVGTHRSLVEVGLFHRAAATFPDVSQIPLQRAGPMDLNTGKGQAPSS